MGNIALAGVLLLMMVFAFYGLGLSLAGTMLIGYLPIEVCVIAIMAGGAVVAIAYHNMIVSIVESIGGDE